MKILYTGSFNPFHNGHQYVYDLACKCWGKDNVWIGIGQSTSKTTTDKTHLQFSVRPITDRIISYDCLTADIVKAHGFDLLIRGIRPGQSIEDETQLLYWNKVLCGVDTLLVPTPPEVNQISSGAIRELFNHNIPVDQYTNKYVLARWSNTKKLIPVFFGKSCCGKTTYLKSIGYNVVEFDRVWPQYVKDLTQDEIEEHIKVLKKSFFKKSDMFLKHVENIAKRMDWDKFFKLFEDMPQTVFDIPVISQYLDIIPIDIVGRLNLIKITTSDLNRVEFAQKRDVNPLLIECNNHFYKDPPFIDNTLYIRPDHR